MARYMEVALERRGVSCIARLLDEDAPRTCAMVWEALPLGGAVYHAKYARNEIYTIVPPFGPDAPGIENPTVMPIPGDLCYFFFPAGMLDRQFKEEKGVQHLPGVVDLALFYGRNNLLLNADVGWVVRERVCHGGEGAQGDGSRGQRRVEVGSGGRASALLPLPWPGSRGAVMQPPRMLDLSHRVELDQEGPEVGVGVVAPFDFVLDREYWRWAPAGVSVYITRTPYIEHQVGIEMAVHGLVRAADDGHADAVFVSCTTVRTFDLLADLERRLNKPVLSANQVTMWAALRAAGLRPSVPGQGLFACRG